MIPPPRPWPPWKVPPETWQDLLAEQGSISGVARTMGYTYLTARRYVRQAEGLTATAPAATYEEYW